MRLDDAAEIERLRREGVEEAISRAKKSLRRYKTVHFKFDCVTVSTRNQFTDRNAFSAGSTTESSGEFVQLYRNNGQCS